MPAPGSTNEKPCLYFVNAAVDYALIGGVSIAAYVAMRAFHSGSRTDIIWSLAAWLAWVINWPHFSATSHRLYQSRRNILQYPVTALAVPLLILVVSAGSFVSPQGVAPWLIKFFVIWSPYHFSGQSVGISLIYARRAGFSVGRWERLAFSGFIFSTFLVQSSMAETGRGDNEFYSVAVPLLGLPLWVPLVLRIWMVACGVALLFFAIRWGIRQGRLLPPIVLLPALSQFVWFVPGATFASFNEFVPLFHSLQYLLVAWLVQLKERFDRDGAIPRSRAYVVRESARWAGINLVGGILLFWLLPRLGALTGATLAFSTAIVLSAVQIHHFFVDGVIWKLKDPRVASPLLANLGDLTDQDAVRALRTA
jgi:hypothetical protein